jgi:hypothetical protein
MDPRLWDGISTEEQALSMLLTTAISMAFDLQQQQALGQLSQCQISMQEMQISTLTEALSSLREQWKSQQSQTNTLHEGVTAISETLRQVVASSAGGSLVSSVSLTPGPFAGRLSTAHELQPQ